MRLSSSILATSLIALVTFSLPTWAELPAKGVSDSKTALTSTDELKLGPRFLRPKTHTRELKREVVLHVGEGATIQPAFTTSLPVGVRGAKVPVETVEIDGGRVDAVLSDSESQRGILLQAPDKILGITTRGHMTMKVDPESVVIGALSGDVLVGHDSKFKPLPSGKLRVISRKTGTVRDYDLPPAPAIKNRSGLSVALTGGVKVNMSTSADRPLLVSIVDETGHLVTSPRRYEPNTPLEVEVPHAGIFYAMARALGEGDIEGPLTQSEKIQVLGLAPGQRSPEEGVFLLGRGERVHLAGTSGLEVRYGSSPSYLPATSSVGLSQPRRTSVEFRNPHDPTQRAVIVLAPRFMRREIELGPAGARWPGEPVKVRVGLWDGSGKLLSPRKDVDVTVTVNSQEIPVNWESTRDGFVGRVIKRTGKGPWVVRVHVVDQRGHTIARDFLEVSSR